MYMWVYGYKVWVVDMSGVHTYYLVLTYIHTFIRTYIHAPGNVCIYVYTYISIYLHIDVHIIHNTTHPHLQTPMALRPVVASVMVHVTDSEWRGILVTFLCFAS
ncbi:uncharacterized protein F4822DRAFT_412221 [Hypoxylon trugodes]|uniref:uncharacterized protein n=1 Tax=Hypoxylon trugodes TaxID=326681 RepID=UPI00219C5FD0|nr:uncharacterized protein F4822DRAFT_412221 [Hypoxylon trugodes]KAI1385171.1 hypothetical protein F4822DRAFT_412221 [Hypoxylon trugodes]